jgi:hypothetical protein
MLANTVPTPHHTTPLAASAQWFISERSTEERTVSSYPRDLANSTGHSLSWADRVTRYLPGLMILLPLTLNVVVIAAITPPNLVPLAQPIPATEVFHP